MGDDGGSTFRTSPAAYDGHVGRYGPELARGLIRLAAVSSSDRVIDVGCGTGLLAAELAIVVGPDNVTAVDPSESFLAACRTRVPGADVRLASAESLPFDRESFDCALSQLVVNFMSDPNAGVAEMRRVTKPGGRVAACVWDYAGEMTLLRAFWDAAAALDPEARSLDEGVSMRNADPDSLRSLWLDVGLDEVEIAELRPSAHYASFAGLWEPFATGVAPSGAYTVSLDPQGQAALRDEFFNRLGSPAADFTMAARAWAVVGRSPTTGYSTRTID